MDCLMCPVTIECHNELNNDIKALTEIEKHVMWGRINLATDELAQLIARFQNRNNKITGR